MGQRKASLRDASARRQRVLGWGTGAVSILAAVGIVLMVGVRRSSMENSGPAKMNERPLPGICFTPAAANLLGEKLAEAFRAGLQDYFRNYGCRNHTRIEVDATGRGARVARTGDGGREETEATSSPGEIDLVPALAHGWTQEKARRVALHEATHVSAPRKVRLAGSKGTLRDGAQVISTQGFSILVSLPSGEETAFRKIGEGAAEALASLVDRAYSVEDKRYFQLGQSTLSLMAGRMTPRSCTVSWNEMTSGPL
jgi:hypothetical protein